MYKEAAVDETELQKIIDQVKAIKNGPRVLQLYMDMCAKCGICAEQCHVAKTMPEKRTNPAVRADLIRRVYKRYGSTWGKVLKAIGMARDIESDELETWVRDFYECSGCRRCAKFCPFGIDNSVLTRKGRAVVHALGKSPFMMSETQRISDETGNDEGQTYAMQSLHASQLMVLHYHQLRRLQGRESPGLLQRLLLHVHTEERRPPEGPLPRDGDLRRLHGHADQLQGLRGVLPPGPGDGDQVHPGPPRRDLRGPHYR